MTQTPITLKRLEEIVRQHFYPGPVAGSTERLCKALNDEIAQALTGAGEPVGWQWRSRIKGGAWDAWERGRYGGEVPPFMDVEERPLFTSPQTPTTDPSSAEPTQCPACSRGEVFGLGADDGSWVELVSSSGGAHPYGVNGMITVNEHGPSGNIRQRVYVADDVIHATPDPDTVPVRRIAPADVYVVLKKWSDRGSLDADHLSALSRDIADRLSQALQVKP